MLMKIQLIISTLLFCLLINSTKVYAKNKKAIDHLEMKVEWMSDSSLFIKASYTHYRLPNDKDTFYFILKSDYNLLSVKADGYVSHGKLLNEWPPFFVKTAPTKKEKLNFYFEYTIDLKKNNHIKSGWVELTLDKLWYPMLGGRSRPEFTSSVIASNFPSSYSIFSNSHVKIEKQGNGSYSFSNKIPEREVILLAGDKMIQRRNSQSNYKINISTSVASTDSVISKLFQNLNQIVDIYNSRLKGALAFEELNLIIRNTSQKELGYGFYRKNMVVCYKEYNIAVLGHEIAHNWTSLITGDNDASVPWMNEGLANYMMLAALHKIDTVYHKVVLSWLEKEAEKAEGQVSGSTMSSPNGYPLYYFKSAMIFWDFSKEIGEEMMFQWITEAIKQHADTEKKFLKALETVAGINRKSEFEKKLYEK